MQILIGRGLDLKILLFFPLFCFQGTFVGTRTPRHAPIAQLVEQLTLNQRVPGSSPCWCTKVGDNNAEVPPVPIPNTVVKLSSAEDTWRVTARENRSLPTQKRSCFTASLFLCGDLTGRFLEKKHRKSIDIDKDLRYNN